MNNSEITFPQYITHQSHILVQLVYILLFHLLYMYKQLNKGLHHQTRDLKIFLIFVHHSRIILLY
jgi:hypothetical protein